MHYLQAAVLRETAKGFQFVAYRFWESFGRETGYAHSWGCREKRGTGKIWLRPDEDLDAAIGRRNAENC